MLRYKIFNPGVSLSKRACQITNSLLELFFSKPLGLIQVVEFPKCGGSWIRNMIRTYINVDMYTGDRLLCKNDVVMTHRLFSAKIKRPIVVIRDPRDMYVSFYYFQTAYQNRNIHSPLFKYFSHDSTRPVEEDFFYYLQAKLLYPSHPWFFYSQFLDNWLNRPDTCLVKYEDCLQEPDIQLIRMLRFLNIQVDLGKISQTIEETNFKAITKKKYGKSRETGQADNAKFHRKGVAGDWKNIFNEEACCLFEKLEGPSLRRLGYEKNSCWIKNFANNKN